MAAVGWLASAASAQRCAAYTKPIEVTRYPGDSAAFICDSPGDTRSEWRVDGRPINFDDESADAGDGQDEATTSSSNFHLSRNGALIVLNVSQAACITRYNLKL